MGFSLKLYQFLIPTRGLVPSNVDTANAVARPPGKLVWIHAPREGDHGVVNELVNRLNDQDPDLWFLVTTMGEAPKDLPDQCFHQILPPDTNAAANVFISHWKPDAMVWVSGTLSPVIIKTAADTKIPLLLVDTGGAFEASHSKWYLPGLTRNTLRSFDTLLSGDEATTLALISAGARNNKVHTTGTLELGIAALPCNEIEWEMLIEQVATRPIWLAAEIDSVELGSVLAAHGQSMRRSHRLLLIIVPAEGENPDVFARALQEQNMNYVRRDEGGEPNSETQVYLADTAEEMGLWYRLSPVSYIGQTHSGRTGTGPDPFEAAALGSVVIHGPALSPHQVAYNRLERAGASRLVAHLGELALAIESVLAPDRAAMMAHAAWQISTAGAEAMEETLDTLRKSLGMQPREDE